MGSRYLSNNDITTIADNAFPPSLYELYLEDNKISSISNGTFWGLSLVNTLCVAQRAANVTMILSLLQPRPAARQQPCCVAFRWVRNCSYDVVRRGARRAFR
jgi:Leucine-rich repeat (LRR) protein